MMHKFSLLLLAALSVIFFQTAHAENIEKHSFSRVTFKTLKKIVTISEGDDEKVFQNWFGYEYAFKDDEISFLRELINKNKRRLNIYTEEDLKAKFLFPLFHRIDFDVNNVTTWYEWTLTMIINGFRLRGKVDCMIAEGNEEPELPYFIMEFKHTLAKSYPKNQLLAEMLIIMEKNETDLVRGAFIIGKNWNFVILKKDGTEYAYFISKQFDSLEIGDMKQIYIYLQAVKTLARKGSAEKVN